jgi:transposase InsO family protein
MDKDGTHSFGRGAQYTSLAFAKRLVRAGLVDSVGTVGAILDDAVAVSFRPTLQTELLDRERLPNRKGLMTAVSGFIEVFSSRQQRLLAISRRRI